MLNILYVDDEPGLLEIGKMFLEAAEGLTVDTLTSASDALSVIPQKKYDAVISDYQMPGMDGIEFLKKVRASGNPIPFILFTGRGREEVVIEAINAGADFYLQKGGDPKAQFAELVLKIRQSVNWRRTEEALSDSERRFRELAELLPLGIYEADIDGLTTYVNRHALEMFGYTDQDVRNGLNVITTIAPEDRPKATRAFRMMADEGSIPNISVEYLALRKDSSTFNVAIFSSPVLRNGRIVGIRGILMDITERKKTEDELRAAHEQLVASDEELRSQYDELAQGEQRIRESEAKYRTLFEKSKDPMLIIDNKRFVDCNAATLTMFGMTSKEQIIDHHPSDISPPFQPDGRDSYEKAEEIMTITLREGSHHFEWLHKRMNGDLFWAEVSLTAIPFGDRMIIHTLWRDITEQKRADEVLRESEKRYRDMFDINTAAMLLLDPKDGWIMDANRAACQYYGYSRDELTHMVITQINVQAPEKTLSAMDQSLSNRGAFFQFRHKKKNGEIRDVEVYSNPIMMNGRTLLHSIIHDVTERTRVEAALKESVNLLRLFIEHAPAALAMLDKELRYVAASSRWRADYHLGDRDLIGQSHLEIFPELTEEIKDVLRRGLAGETSSASDDKFERLDGSVQWLTWEVRPWFTTTQEVGGVIIFSEDITKKKTAELALRESEEKYRSLVETSFDGIIIHQDGLIIFANSTAGRLIGYEPVHDVIGKPILSFVHPDFRTLVHQRMESATAETQPVIREKFLRLDGSSIDVDVVAIPFVWKDKPAVHVVFRDISEQIETEEALRESEEKFRSFVENANEIVFSLNPDGIFTYVSPKWTELLGHDVSEVIGKSAAVFIYPDDFLRISEFIRQTIMTGNKASGIEYRIQHKNNTWQWHSQSISPIYDAGGRVIAVQGICHDITERKRSEDALHLANRQLTLLTGVTRHDILNKVSIARGYLKIAEMKYGDPTQAQYLEKTDSAIADIKSQIEFTRVYQNLGAHDPQWIDLDTVMPRQQVPAMITLNADVRGVVVLADPMLEKVFSNLLDNSLRHGERVTEIAVSSHRSDGNLVIVWEDNGIGVASDEKERIFERGFGKNTGMGLFLVREILSITGITITENGEPGKGARFEIVVPKGTYRFPDSK